jgi:threonyl-tRNA synthetase
VTVHADVDDRGESVGKRIRDAQLQKVPYILVVGDREVEDRTVGVRERGEDKGARGLAAFIDDLVAEVRERRLPAG